MSLDPTKARLLEAAGEEFAEKGFEGATVRAICSKAGTNLAAVNYHFGDKVRLYEQTVLEAHRCGPVEIGEHVFQGSTPVEQFRSYVRWFLENIFDQQSKRTWHQALMLRELLQPTSAADVLVREAIRPRFEHLKSLIRAFRPEADERKLNALAFSVVGQIIHYKVARTISVRLVGEDALESLDVEFLSEHISEFCLAALRHPASTKPDPAPSTSASAPSNLAHWAEESR